MAPPPKDQKRPPAPPAQGAGKSVPSLAPVPGGKSPTGQIPAQGAGKSMSSLPQVGGGGTGKSVPSLPQVGGRTTTGEIKAPRTSTGGIPVQGGPASSGSIPIDPHKLNRAHMTDAQKKQQDDAFASWSAGRKRANFIASPTNPGRMKEVIEEDFIDPDWNPDGTRPLPDLDMRETWRAVKSPFTSKFGARTKESYEQAFKQFAIGNNPRYDEDGPGKHRGHIFVWDVSRAMGCEIPHFVGARELTVGQTADWLRHEGPMRQWMKISASDAFRWVELGMMVVALPKDQKLKHLAIVTPQPDAELPLLTGAGLVIGHLKTPEELFGTDDLECYYHA
jgi:hypothetical protein